MLLEPKACRQPCLPSAGNPRPLRFREQTSLAAALALMALPTPPPHLLPPQPPLQHCMSKPSTHPPTHPPTHHLPPTATRPHTHLLLPQLPVQLRQGH